LSQSVTVTNVAPTPVIVGLPVSASEGSQVAVTASATDPAAVDNSAGFTYGWTVTKNGSAYATGTGSGLTFTPDDNGVYAITLTVTDKDGGTSTASLTLTGTNVAPAAAITGAPATSPEGTAITLGSSVTDPGSTDATAGFTYAWSVTKNGAAFA